MAFFIGVTPIGSVSASMFQGLGKGFHSLGLTFIREILLVLVCSYLFAIGLNLGEIGVWIGISVGNIFGCLIAYVYTNYYIKKYLTT
jgi:Na+-driven multidrug efflux pump